MRLASGDKNLDFKRLKNPELFKPIIEDDTKGRKLLQLQENQKFDWQKYTFQEVVESVAVESIVAAINAQCVEDLEEDYFGYKNQTIKMMITQIRTWYVITTK